MRGKQRTGQPDKIPKRPGMISASVTARGKKAGLSSTLKTFNIGKFPVGSDFKSNLFIFNTVGLATLNEHSAP